MKPRHILTAIVIAFIWGTNFSMMKKCVSTVPPIFFTACRTAMVGVFAMVVSKPKVSWRVMAFLGIMLGVGKLMLLGIGLHMGITAGLSSIVLQLQAFFTVLLSSIVLREKPGKYQIIGMVSGFTGTAFIALGVGGHTSLPGLLLTLIAAFVWAVANVIMRRLDNSVDTLNLVIWMNIFAPWPLLGISLMAEGYTELKCALALAGWPDLFFMGFGAYFSILLGYALWGRLLNLYPSAIVAPFSLLVPVFGFTISYVFLGEALNPSMIGGIVLVLAGLAFNQLHSVDSGRALQRAD